MTFAHELALRKAVRDRLLASAPLAARLGGPRIYDPAPRGAARPYLVFGSSQARDWSTMTERGVEFLLALEVWSDASGVREALEIATLAAEALHDAPMSLPGAACAVLRVQDAQTAREGVGRFTRCRLRLRALVETN